MKIVEFRISEPMKIQGQERNRGSVVKLTEERAEALIAAGLGKIVGATEPEPEKAQPESPAEESPPQGVEGEAHEGSEPEPEPAPAPRKRRGRPKKGT